MSIENVKWVLEDPELAHGERIVLLVMAEAAGKRNECWLAVKTIAQRANLSRRQVQRCLRALESKRYVGRVGLHPSQTIVYAIQRGGVVDVTGEATQMSRGA